MRGRRAVFLDRDGTVLELVAYLRRPEEVRLVPGAAAALRRLGDRGWLRVLVSNQSGIARGLFTPEEVEAVHARMLELLRAEGADLEAIEICPHHPDHTGACPCRKPSPGMLLRSAERLGIDGARSWTIGDRFHDIEAGRAIATRGILVLTGYGRQEARAAPASAWRGVAFAAWDLPAAVAFLLRWGDDSPEGTQRGGGRSTGV